MMVADVESKRDIVGCKILSIQVESKAGIVAGAEITQWELRSNLQPKLHLRITCGCNHAQHD